MDRIGYWTLTAISYICSIIGFTFGLTALAHMGSEMGGLCAGIAVISMLTAFISASTVRN